MGEAAASRCGVHAPGSRVQDFWRDETGATSIEYGLIALGIAIAIVAGVNAVGGALDVRFTAIEALF